MVEAELTEMTGNRLVFMFIARPADDSDHVIGPAPSSGSWWTGTASWPRPRPGLRLRLRLRSSISGRRPRVGQHVDQVGHAGGERAAQRRGDPGRVGDQFTGSAQRGNDLVVAAARLQVGRHVIAVQGLHGVLLQPPDAVVTQTMTTGSRCRTSVSTSISENPAAPSPSSSTTCAAGRAILAAIA